MERFSPEVEHKIMEPKKLHRIERGMTLGFIAPSSPVYKPEDVESAAAKAESMGYRVKISKGCYARKGYLAGEDALRSQELNRFIHDPQVDALVCIRGGYGAARILRDVDWGALRDSARPVLGYSDVTALHLAIWNYCRMPSLHGPMPTTEWIGTDFPEFSQESLEKLLGGGQIGQALHNPPEMEAPQVWKGGKCEGILLGGNLSLVCSLLGTGHLPDMKGCILFLEDVDENVYRIDRMLTQLRDCGILSECAGIVLGTFTDCTPQEKYPDMTLDEVLRERVLPAVNGPVLTGLQIGHCKEKISLAVGIRYCLDGDAGMLVPLESAFEDT